MLYRIRFDTLHFEYNENKLARFTKKRGKTLFSFFLTDDFSINGITPYYFKLCIKHTVCKGISNYDYYYYSSWLDDPVLMK